MFSSCHKRVIRLFLLSVGIGCLSMVPSAGASGPDDHADKILVAPKGSPATPVADFTTRQKTPPQPTSATVGWNDQGLTVTFECVDSTVVSHTRPRDDDNMWRDDAVEVFLDPGHTQNFNSPWIHILVSAAGDVYDERGPGIFTFAGERQASDRSYTAEKMQSRVTRTQEGWRAELLIPWEDIGCCPQIGEAWGLNLIRGDQPGDAYTCWAPVNPFLELRQWGHLIFADEHGQAGEAIVNLKKAHENLNAELRKRQELVERMTRGEGFIPGQSRENPATEEIELREQVERRKDQMLANRSPVRHPVLFSADQWARSRENIADTPWGKAWYANTMKVADYIVSQPDSYIEQMIPELTPTSPYGFTCPNCVGNQTQEGKGAFVWDYRHPDSIRCQACGQSFPDARFPETGILACPRRGQNISYYRNKAERAHPDDRSGAYAWKWVNKPIHVSFDGVIRQGKIKFMVASSYKLGLAYQLTDDSRYAEKAAAILMRLAVCMPKWLYHDYWDTFADCDPMYAAWRSDDLRLEWKRNPNGTAYGDVQSWVADSNNVIRAGMLRDYWGAGRVSPGGDALLIEDVCAAYDLIWDAKTAEGKDLWTTDRRDKVERDLILESLIGAEPFVGGAGKAENISNKGPYAYAPMAMAGKCLGLPAYMDVALRGYEAIRDRSFVSDGFSHESPAYTMMFLQGIIKITEALHGFRWPRDFPGRSGTVDLYRDDPKLRLILRAALEGLQPNGTFLPLSDTSVGSAPAPTVFEIGLHRFPEDFSGALPAIYRGQQAGSTNVSSSSAVQPGKYAVFNLTDKAIQKDRLQLPSIYFPAWQTAILRHGEGPDATVLALPFNPPGNHRQRDNLALFYSDSGRTLLGEMGYVGDSVMRHWGASTLSHNLVVVDGQDQLFVGVTNRTSRLRLMAISPRVSVVEGESHAYTQCSEYRRLVALIKGPEAQTFAVDIFRVRGGSVHAFRMFSEIASSDAPDGALTCNGLTLPPGQPIPNFGGSINKEHIFGLHDLRTDENPPASWQATWSQTDRSYRLHMLSKVDTVAVSHGPGQETTRQVGRRVRYLDAINSGAELHSVFVAVHEPSSTNGVMSIQSTERLPVPETAGPDAVALRIESSWGTYLIFSEFSAEAQVAGVRFQGKFGIFCTTSNGKRWLFSSGAATLKDESFGVANAPAEWAGAIGSQTDDSLTTETPCPRGWPAIPDGVTNYVLTDATGYPVKNVGKHRIVVTRFPLMTASDFSLLAVQYRSE